jgi:hypothetical protein
MEKDKAHRFPYKESCDPAKQTSAFSSPSAPQQFYWDDNPELYAGFRAPEVFQDPILLIHHTSISE